MVDLWCKKVNSKKNLNFCHKTRRNAEKNLEEYSKKKSWEARTGFELGTFSILAQDTASEPAGMFWLI